MSVHEPLDSLKLNLALEKSASIDPVIISNIIRYFACIKHNEWVISCKFGEFETS